MAWAHGPMLGHEQLQPRRGSHRTSRRTPESPLTTAKTLVGATWTIMSRASWRIRLDRTCADSRGTSRNPRRVHPRATHRMTPVAWRRRSCAAFRTRLFAWKLRLLLTYFLTVVTARRRCGAVVLSGGPFPATGSLRIGPFPATRRTVTVHVAGPVRSVVRAESTFAIADRLRPPNRHVIAFELDLACGASVWQGSGEQADLLGAAPVGEVQALPQLRVAPPGPVADADRLDHHREPLT